VAVRLPWSAWYEDTFHPLAFPGHWTVDVLQPPKLPALGSREICASLQYPIVGPTISEMAAGKQTACLAVDDLARPTKAADVLPHVLAQLHEAGLKNESISIVVATGTHRSLDQRQIAWKVGEEVLSSFRVECHNANATLAPTGIQFGRSELRINRTFLEADVKIGIGSVLPHSFAGYSGGAKQLLPGLADVAATARSHKFVLMGLRGGQDPDKNRFRLEAEEIGRQLGFHYTVCVVPDSDRNAVGVIAGDLVAAHREACRFAARAYATILETTYDCLVVNAYPKDGDLIQSENSLISLKTAKSPVIREGGLLLLTTAASEGMGRHGLFEPGGASYRRPQPKRALEKRDFWIYAPTVSPSEAHRIFWHGYPFFHDRAELEKALAERFPGSTRAAVLPCAPMQQIDDRRAG